MLEHLLPEPPLSRALVWMLQSNQAKFLSPLMPSVCAQLHLCLLALLNKPLLPRVLGGMMFPFKFPGSIQKPVAGNALQVTESLHQTWK